MEATLADQFDHLHQRGLDELVAEGFPTHGLIAERSLDMRYQGQSYELPVPIDDHSPSHFLPRFHQLHHQRYSHTDPSRPAEVVNIHLKLTVPTEAPVLPSLPAGGLTPPPPSSTAAPPTGTATAPPPSTIAPAFWLATAFRVPLSPSRWTPPPPSPPPGAPLWTLGEISSWNPPDRGRLRNPLPASCPR